MKIVILSLLVCLTAYSQKKFVYNYSINNKQTGYTHAEDMVLYVDKNLSIFTSLKEINFVKNLNTQQQLGGNINFSMQDFAKVKTKTIYHYANQKIFYYEYLLGAQIKTPVKVVDNWVLENDSKSIDGKKVNKATILLYDRKWIAWYDLSVPIQEGPYMFKGLPGLIVELYDTKEQFYFTFKGITTEKFTLQEIGYYDNNKYKELSLVRYKDLVKKALNNPYEFRNANAALKFPAMSTEQIKDFNIKEKQTFQSILLKDI